MIKQVKHLVTQCPVSFYLGLTGFWIDRLIFDVKPICLQSAILDLTKPRASIEVLCVQEVLSHSI